MHLDDRGEPEPDLATTWGVSGDGLRYRFTIGAGAAWSSGAPVTPADVVATVSAVQADGFPDTRLAAEWKGVRAAVDGADGVVMTLPAPRASFVTEAADLPVVPEAHARTPLAELERARAQPMPADGLYRVRSSDARSVTVEVNPATRLHPRLRVLQFVLEPDFDTAARALAARQVDALEAATPSERSALAKLPGVTLHDTVSFRFVDLILNARRPGLDDVAVRKAVASAINRHVLVASALDGAARPQVDAEPAGIAWLGPPADEDPQPALAARALDA
ncbi:MAG TPA: ABC transporter substrate-binding protein, partial [Candidatus Dormibacteraeota bacterium]|nr:ABC transporter substrate-binding protein [Candidatus Dormibacteraeota bacterium]